MDKLQLYITMSHGDYRHLMEINPEDEVKAKVKDITEAIEDVTYDPTDKCIFYVLKSTDMGAFVIVIRTIPDRPADHLAAWIFIPAEIAISDSEANAVVDQVAKIVMNPTINKEHIEALHGIFGKSYTVVDNAAALVENHGSRYAHRFFGGYTGNFLSDIISSKRYQTSYLPYAGVIVADRSKVTEISGPNLTDAPLEPMVRILPPKSENPDFQPMIFDRPFDRPYLAPLMDTVEIIWRGASDVDIRQSVVVSHPDMCVEAIDEAKRQTPQMATRQVPPHAPIPTSAPATAASDDTAISQPVEPDPEPIARSTDGRPTAKPSNVYNFEIPAKSASISGMINFTISSRSRLQDSPIEGYELSDDIQEGASRTNHLVYVPGNNLQNNALWAIAGFVVGIVLTLLCTCGSNHSASDSDGALAVDTAAVVATDTTTVVASKPEDTSINGAIKYLDTNKKWTKAELDSYPDLVGLYEDLNTINRDKIINTWAPKLQESREFVKLVDHVKNGRKKSPRLKTGQTTFNTGSDQTISVRSYLNCIDP